jgi:hypothetical protein
MNIIVKGIRYIANIGLIKWEFEYTLFAFQDELVSFIIY